MKLDAGIIDNMVDAVFTTDRKGKIVEFNPAFTKIWSWGEEMIGKPATKLMIKGDEARVREAIKESFRKGCFKNLKCTALTKNRREISVLVNFTVMKDPAGNTKGLLALIRNVTECKEIEEALKASEREKALILNSVSELVTYQDRKLRIRWVNRAAAESLGRKPEKLVGKHCYQLWHQRPTPCRGCPLVRAMKTGQPERAEVTTLDGRVWLIQADPVRAENGKIIGAVEVTLDITVRRREEEALRESEKTARALLNVPAVAVLLMDSKGIILDVNQTTEERLSKSREELIGVLVWDLTWPEVRAHRKRYFARVLRTGQPVRFEDYREDMWNDNLYHPIVDGQGKVTKVAIIARDISERKRAEEKLAEFNEIFRNLGVDTKKNIDFIVQKTGEILQGVCSLYNRLDDEEKSLYAWSVHNLPPNFNREDTPIGHICYEATIKGKDKPVILGDLEGTKYEETDPNVKKYGLKSYLGFPVLLGGRTIGSLCIVDVKKRKFTKTEVYIISTLAKAVSLEEERRRAEEALRESEEKYRSLVERAQDSIFILQDGVVRYANPRLAEMSGYTVDEVIGTPFIDYVDPADADRVAGLYRRRLAGEEVESIYEAVFRRQDGSKVYAQINAGLISYQGRSADLVYLRDITVQKRIEEELLKADKLESLGLLAGGIAHDFNNILTSILGNISLARMYVRSEEKMARRLAKAENACLQARSLTERLLTFSRGGVPIKVTASISGLLRETASFALSGSDVRCRFSLPAKLWPLKIDEGQISQVINNLIINADQALPGGGVIKVTAKNITVPPRSNLPVKPGKYVRITVEDSGVGIAEEHLPKIFDPFFTTKESGRGLGLTSAYSVIKNHDGFITVKSEVGTGTSIFVYLPASAKAVRKKKKKKEGLKYGQARILLMDDEKTVREVSGQMIKYLGYEVSLTGDGAAAIRRYQRARKAGKPYDLVIMDLTVRRGMGGIEAIDKLRKIDPKVKAVVASGYSKDPVMSSCKEYGFRGCITKPYKIEELSKILHRLTRKK